MTTGETAYDEEREAWKADVAEYFRARGFPETDIHIGMQWGLDWLERCSIDATRQAEATGGNLTDEQVGKLLYDSWHAAYTGVAPDIDREGRRFPALRGSEGLVVPTVIGAATETFRFGYGTGLEDADRALGLMETYIGDQQLSRLSLRGTT